LLDDNVLVEVTVFAVAIAVVILFTGPEFRSFTIELGAASFTTTLADPFSSPPRMLLSSPESLLFDGFCRLLVALVVPVTTDGAYHSAPV
jgi:hypothetical protein